MKDLRKTKYYKSLTSYNSNTVITDIEELETPQETLERLRKAIRDENISYGEILELESLKRYIKEDDIELLQWITNEK